MNPHPFESYTLFTCLEKIAEDVDTSGHFLSQVEPEKAFESSRWAANRFHEVSRNIKWIIENREQLIVSEINEIDVNPVVEK